MSCLSREQIVQAAFARADSTRFARHLDDCDTCCASVDELRSLARQLNDAHARFDQGHLEARERLLEHLPADWPPERVRFAVWIKRWIGGTTMRQRIALSGVAVAATLGVLLVWSVSSTKSLSAMEKMAAGIRKARSTVCTIQMVVGTETASGKFYWQSPGSVRMEMYRGDKLAQTDVFPHRKPGLRVNHERKTYQHRPARQGQFPPLLMLERLSKVSGEADRDLGTKEIGSKMASGFEIAMAKMDPDVPSGAAAIWIDSQSKFPVLIEYSMTTGGVPSTFRMMEFQWNGGVAPDLLLTEPPADYANKTREPVPLDEQIRRMTEALGIYAELSGGHYPKVNIVYGDVTRDAMFKFIGIEGRPTAEDFRSDKYAKVMKAARGFGMINMVLRDNPDAAYHGKTVGPNDSDKVLLSWRLPDGKYQVIFGDLKSQTVPAERLDVMER